MDKNDQVLSALNEHLRFESLLGELSASLVNLSLQSIDGAIESSIKRIAEFFEVDRCHLGMFSDDHSRIIISHAYSKFEINLPKIDEVSRQFLPYIYNQIFKNEIIAIEKPEELPPQAKEELKYMQNAGIKSLAVVPLQIDDVVKFSLSLSIVKKHQRWEKHTIKHIRIVGNILANVLNRHLILSQIEKEKQWSEAILQGMPQLAYVFDKDGKLKRWNKNFEKVLGYTAEELQDKYILDFIYEPDHQEEMRAVNKVFDAGEDQTAEERIVTKSGRVLHYYGSGSLAIIDDEEYMIGMTIDMSKLKEAQKQIEMQLKDIKGLKEQLEAENIYLRQELKSSHKFYEIIGESNILKHILYRVEQVAPTDSTVLLEGETGTCKELFARAIHEKSKRSGKPMITVNCASLPSSLIESELFGHEKGAFTGAIQNQIGRFELANGGTIFLDEVGEIPLELQSKLLRVLQEGTFERIGSVKTKTVDVRIIAATNRNLEEEINSGRFRSDLYYRLNVYPITIVPLRDRKDDIPLLVNHFVKKLNHKLGKHITKIPKKVMNQLSEYSWPGNIRELENIIERAVILSPKSTLSVELQAVKDFVKEDKLVSLADHEREYIEKVLQKTLWRIDGPQGAARILDMHPETLRSRMRKLGIARPTQNI